MTVTRQSSNQEAGWQSVREAVGATDSGML